jgi:hypothetical protein
VVERKHQHILSTCRAIMFQSNMPKLFWNFALAHATYIINRIPSKNLANKIPYEIIFGHKPNISTLRVSSCLTYASSLSRK